MINPDQSRSNSERMNYRDSLIYSSRKISSNNLLCKNSIHTKQTFPRSHVMWGVIGVNAPTTNFCQLIICANCFLFCLVINWLYRTYFLQFSSFSELPKVKLFWSLTVLKILFVNSPWINVIIKLNHKQPLSGAEIGCKYCLVVE